MNGSLIELGMAATTLALFLACASLALSLASVAMRHPAFAAVAQRALIANFGLSTIACATAVWAFLQNDFSVAYVAQNSNSRLPLVYRMRGWILFAWTALKGVCRTRNASNREVTKWQRQRKQQQDQAKIAFRTRLGRPARAHIRAWLWLS